MGHAHRQAIVRGVLLRLQALGALLLGLVLVVAVYPVAGILAIMLTLYAIVSWRRGYPQLPQHLIITVAFMVPVALYFVLAAAS
jgi:hypothetical protein